MLATGRSEVEVRDTSEERGNFSPGAGERAGKVEEVGKRRLLVEMHGEVRVVWRLLRLAGGTGSGSGSLRREARCGVLPHTRQAQAVAMVAPRALLAASHLAPLACQAAVS